MSCEFAQCLESGRRIPAILALGIAGFSLVRRGLQPLCRLHLLSIFRSSRRTRTQSRAAEKAGSLFAWCQPSYKYVLSTCKGEHVRPWLTCCMRQDAEEKSMEPSTMLGLRKGMRVFSKMSNGGLFERNELPTASNWLGSSTLDKQKCR